MKLSLKTELLPLFFLLIAVTSGFFFYTRFPEKVAVHWNFAGQIDRYGGRLEGAFMIPAMLILIYILFLVFPAIDPKRNRYQEFEKTFKIFRSAIIGVLLAVYLAMGLSNIGFDIKIGQVVAFIIGSLMIILGNYMGKIKNNWFMGIRNPWTLSSENVWNKTHRMGGWVFIAFGLIIMVAPLLPPLPSAILFASGVVLTVFGTTIYSYWLFSKEKK